MEINQRSSMHYLLKDILKGNLSYGACWISVFGVDGKSAPECVFCCGNYVYTKAAQYQELPAESSFRLEKVGGTILGMVKQTVN